MLNPHAGGAPLTKIEDNIWTQFIDSSNQWRGCSFKGYGQNNTCYFSIDNGGSIEVARSFATGISPPWPKWLEAGHQYFHQNLPSQNSLSNRLYRILGGLDKVSGCCSLMVYKQVLVAAMSIAGFQFYELEAFFAIKLKDVAGDGYFEWVATYPVNNIAPG